MSYPTRLLPKKRDKIIKEIDAQHVLCGWVEKALQLKIRQADARLKQLRVRLPGYSSNKIPPSAVDDVKIEFYNRVFKQNWIEGEKTVVPSDNDFHHTERNHFLFRVEDIYKYSKPYSFPLDNPAQECHSQVDVIHKPRKANISHFEFDVKIFYHRRRA